MIAVTTCDVDTVGAAVGVSLTVGTDPDGGGTATRPCCLGASAGGWGCPSPGTRSGVGTVGSSTRDRFGLDLLRAHDRPPRDGWRPAGPRRLGPAGLTSLVAVNRRPTCGGNGSRPAPPETEDRTHLVSPSGRARSGSGGSEQRGSGWNGFGSPSMLVPPLRLRGRRGLRLPRDVAVEEQAPRRHRRTSADVLLLRPH
jgi:hypothetical protein